jgi:tetratricopeptide (TPR) repeat protein
MARPPLSEDDAVRLLVACVADVRDDPTEPAADDLAIARRVVQALDFNRAAIHLIAARARGHSFAELEQLVVAFHEAAMPEPSLRALLARGEAARLHGRLQAAADDLQAVLRDAGSDTQALAQAHRLLGSVYRAQGNGSEALVHKERALDLCLALGDPARIAVARGELGTVLGALGQLRRARTCHEQALAAHRELGRRKNEGIELSYLGVSLHRAGLMDEARRAHTAALAIHGETNNARSLAADHMHLGYVALELAEPEVARSHLDLALGLFRAVGDRALEGVALSYLGALEVATKRPEVAGPLLQQALAVHQEVGSARHASTTWMHIGHHHHALGELDAEAQCYAKALVLGAQDLESENRAWLLSLTGRTDEAQQVPIEDAATKLAVALLAAANNAHKGQGLSDARSLLRDAAPGKCTSSRVRRAAAMLEYALAAQGQQLLIAKDGRWFVGLDGVRVDLARRKPLRLALLLLAERWFAAPGQGVPWSQVLEVAWPGQRVDAESGFGRVRNALSQLRKMGLRDVLRTRDDGYLLAPECPVRWAEI